MEWNEGFELEAVGLYAQARQLPAPRCELCRGLGRREVDLEGVRRVVRCRCQRLPDRIALFNRARIPARHAHCTMENFEHPYGDPVWTPTYSWLGNFQPDNLDQKGIVWTGKPGCGKTHLMVAVIRELIFRYGVECRFIEFTHLISSIREGIERHDSDATTLTPLVNVPVLAIDELGKGRKTEFELSVIDELITRRYNSRKLILGTSNFPQMSKEEKQKSSNRPLKVAAEPSNSLARPEELEPLRERLGARVYSRLYEVVKIWEILGEDYRVKRGR